MRKAQSMIDRLGRSIDYLRISLTDRCNLRCVYCMPEDGVVSISHQEILTYDEILRICRIMAADGLKNIKLTGGEPLVRKNCTFLLRELKRIPGIEKVTLTTNGVLLKDQLKELADAGLDAVNISLDTLNPEKYAEITRRDQLQNVLEGIEETLKYPQITVKINCVPVIEDRENLLQMAALAKKYPIHVRFIEIMPLGQGKKYSFWNEETMLDVITQTYGRAVPYKRTLGNGPAHYYELEDFQGKIGFISAVSHRFCEQCNRLRLTSDGYLKACLQYQIGADLKIPLRRGCTEKELRDIIYSVLDRKPAGHHFFEDKTDADEVRMMAQIGG